uniref:Glycosyl transferase family 2 putative n=1 Tax=Albugo laibachii Nc14 TaxID=890382 RepID=F0WS58_9STRA|nr:glycosyl transferase family 2 putative [Albugo laibachii Nc14]|eukprot:CCA24176.1 glycosyl transferase family 2 putative [Albugo laibachii Nc14]
MRLDVICFSKDRIFQLSEYLRTFNKHVFYQEKPIDEWHPSQHRHDAVKGDEVQILMSVICKCSTPEVKKDYEGLAMKYATVNFMYEGEIEERSFASCLLEVFDRQKTSDIVSDSFVWFNVDDAFIFDRVDVDQFLPHFFCQSVGQSHKWNFAFHLKLTPNVWRSHMTNEHMLPLPPFQRFVAQEKCGSIANGKDFFLTFDPAQGRVDWNYPWDLSGSIYSSLAVEFIVQGILAKHGRAGVNHPNVLELYGNQFLKQSGRIESVQCACPSQAVMHLLAVNQVQDVFKNPLCKMELITKEDTMCNPSTADDLGRYYEKGCVLDEQFYRNDRFPSVHIGQVCLITGGSGPYPTKAQDLVSVIIPAHNAEHYVENAMRSIMNQTYENLEIIVIDDASTDSTRNIIESLMKEDDRVHLVKNSKKLGVAVALNAGFANAKGAYFARMDADDISMPERIAKQVAFLEKNPNIDILGTSIMTFTHIHTPLHDGQSLYAADINPGRIITYSLSPIITQWHMLFGCHFAHPTAVMRRSVVDHIISTTDDKVLYDESWACCEDYDLWLRCLYDHQFVIASLGDVLLMHRKHKRNVSTIQRSRQKDEADVIINKHLTRWIGLHVRIDIIQLLRASASDMEKQNGSEATQTSVDFSETIQIIHKLRDYFLSSCNRRYHNIPPEELSSASSYIRQDAVAREGMLALQAFTCNEDFAVAARMWLSYCERNEKEGRNAFCNLLGTTNAKRCSEYQQNE